LVSISNAAKYAVAALIISGFAKAGGVRDLRGIGRETATLTRAGRESLTGLSGLLSRTFEKLGQPLTETKKAIERTKLSARAFEFERAPVGSPARAIARTQVIQQQERISGRIIAVKPEFQVRVKASEVVKGESVKAGCERIYGAGSIFCRNL